jgi:hypothetical protein
VSLTPATPRLRIGLAPEICFDRLDHRGHFDHRTNIEIGQKDDFMRHDLTFE